MFQIYLKIQVFVGVNDEIVMVQNLGNLSMDVDDESSEVNAIERVHVNVINMAVDVVVNEIYGEESGKHGGTKA